MVKNYTGSIGASANVLPAIIISKTEETEGGDANLFG
jgi:hypothetical protein